MIREFRLRYPTFLTLFRLEGPAFLMLAASALLLACDDEAGSSSECSALTLTPMDGSAFTGSDECSGVEGNHVLRDSDTLQQHNSDYCDTFQACGTGPACQGGPGSAAGQMVIYVFGTVTGCSATASIQEVRRCSDRLEVDYRIEGQGDCASTINAWASVWVAKSDLPAQFNLLD